MAPPLCVFLLFFHPCFVCLLMQRAAALASLNASALNKDVYFHSGSAAMLAPPTLATIATLATTASSLRQLLLTPAGGRLLWQVFCCSCRLPMAPSGPSQRCCRRRRHHEGRRHTPAARSNSARLLPGRRLIMEFVIEHLVSIPGPAGNLEPR